MFLSELRIENFRMFGEGERALVVPFRPGLTALVGENDTGKTALIDAIRFALGTRDQEFIRVEESDFHQPPNDSPRRNEIRIRCKFEDLTKQDIPTFVEYLTYENTGTDIMPVLYVNWKAIATTRAVGQRQFTSVEIRSGQSGDGPQIDTEVRTFLSATYLRPLRDAERAMSAGRGSRLSQILQHTPEVKGGQAYDPQSVIATDPENLSVLGIGDYANDLLGKHPGIKRAKDRLNSDYLENLSFIGDRLRGSISVSGSKGDEKIRLRQLLEKLELDLGDERMPDPPPGRGLGSNNLLFMACELLLLGSEKDGVFLLLIEEPEAHLHPQRQLRLMQFLQKQASQPMTEGQKIQIILTTHSPNLASAINLNNLTLLHEGKAFPLESGRTRLDQTDYAFLERFLDVTKANMFFARGLLIVEGDAENILLPTLARLIGRDLTESGVSIINVGGTGLRRFSRIYQRKNPDEDGTINIPIACVTDLDVMPECAPVIIGKVKTGDNWPAKNERSWRAKSDFTAEESLEKRQKIYDKASGQHVETFVADEWTLEYDLAYFGFAREVWIAGKLAKNDEAINAGTKTSEGVVRNAMRSFKDLNKETHTKETLASHVYALFTGSSVSKPIAAQYLASLLDARRDVSSDKFRDTLPPYIVRAIDYVTRPSDPGRKVDPKIEDRTPCV